MVTVTVPVWWDLPALCEQAGNGAEDARWCRPATDDGSTVELHVKGVTQQSLDAAVKGYVHDPPTPVPTVDQQLAGVWQAIGALATLDPPLPTKAADRLGQIAAARRPIEEE